MRTFFFTDVDHPGVSNAQLIKENSPMAVVYKKRSMAEQNSVEVGSHREFQFPLNVCSLSIFHYSAMFLALLVFLVLTDET